MELISSIRPGLARDAQALTALALRSKAHWGYDEWFMAMCRDELTMTPERIVAEEVIVAEASDDRIIGFASWGREPDGSADVTSCFVEPDAIGKGVGMAVLAAVLDQIRGAGIPTVMVDSDPNAEGFYRRAGFVSWGRTPSRSIPARFLPRLRMDL